MEVGGCKDANEGQFWHLETAAQRPGHGCDGCCTAVAAFATRREPFAESRLFNSQICQFVTTFGQTHFKPRWAPCKNGLKIENGKFLKTRKFVCSCARRACILLTYCLRIFVKLRMAAFINIEQPQPSVICTFASEFIQMSWSYLVPTFKIKSCTESI